jgi:hypothetical protein
MGQILCDVIKNIIASFTHFGLRHERVIRSRKESEQDKKYQHEKDKTKLVLSIHRSSLLR